MANGLPDQLGGLPPVSPGLPAGPPPAFLFNAISQLAARERPNVLDKVRQVVDLLEEIRERDPKIAGVASMAIHILRNGQKGLSDFQEDSPGRFPEGKTGVRGVVG